MQLRRNLLRIRLSWTWFWNNKFRIWSVSNKSPWNQTSWIWIRSRRGQPAQTSNSSLAVFQSIIGAPSKSDWRRWKRLKITVRRSAVCWLRKSLGVWIHFLSIWLGRFKRAKTQQIKFGSWMRPFSKEPEAKLRKKTCLRLVRRCSLSTSTLMIRACCASRLSIRAMNSFNAEICCLKKRSDYLKRVCWCSWRRRRQRRQPRMLNWSDRVRWTRSWVAWTTIVTRCLRFLRRLS